MKNVKILLAACLLAVATVTSAQSTADAWSGIRASYNSFKFDADGGDFDAVMGLDLGYVKSFAVSTTMPLFVEVGANALYVTGDLYDEKGYSESVNMLSVAIPVNFGYKYVINDKLSVFPYVGAYLRGNITGEIKSEGTDFDYDYETGDMKEVKYSNEMDMFDSKEGDGSRIQVGMQIGATLNIDKYNVGISYGFDFNEILEKTKTNKLALTLGYNF